MREFFHFIDQKFDTAFIMGMAWPISIIAISVLYRLWRQKPIFTSSPADTIYKERWTSGRSNKNLLTKLGGARNCLRVSLTPLVLDVRPHFPFNLLFVPEIYGLEMEIPRSQIQDVSREKGAFTDDITIKFGALGEEERSIKLTLRDPDAFMQALNFQEKKSHFL